MLDLEWKIFASSTNQKLFCIQENVLFQAFLVKVKGNLKGRSWPYKGISVIFVELCRKQEVVHLPAITRKITMVKAVSAKYGNVLFRAMSACLGPRKEGDMPCYSVSLNHIHESCIAFQDNLYKSRRRRF